MKIYGDREAKVFFEEADNTFLDLHNSSDYKKAEFRIVLLLIENNSQFKNNLKHFNLDAKFHSSFACFRASSGYLTITQGSNSTRRVAPSSL